MAYQVSLTSTFKKDFKRCMKRGLDMSLITKAMDILEESGRLPDEYYPHQLKGKRKNQWECHLKPDWLMVWEQNDNQLTLLFLETGTHSDLFKK